MISKEIAEKLVPNPTGYSPPEVAQWVNCDIRSFDYSVLGQYVPHTTKRDMANEKVSSDSSRSTMGYSHVGKSPPFLFSPNYLPLTPKPIKHRQLGQY
jgi:hypothetical protein